MKARVAIIGSGPAALMAASQIALRFPSVELHLFEKRAGFGRKLLIAGSSGLNISNSLPVEQFSNHYTGGGKKFWDQILGAFSPNDWISFIQKNLNQETFLGTSDRYFVRDMKASNLLKSWMDWLESHGLRSHAKKTLSSFRSEGQEVELQFEEDEVPLRFDRAVFALGGGSWEENEPEWCELFRKSGLQFENFRPSNVGYEIAWPEALLKEAEGKPLKKVTLTTDRGSKLGELVITRYGLEGTPIYFVGKTGKAFLDLKPDLSESEILTRLSQVTENLAPIRRVKQKLNLSEGSLALLFHLTSMEEKKDLKLLISRIKKLPITLKEPRPLLEAISSSGGLSFSEVNESLELKKFPGIYVCGEMLDWDAPTGGFLIQGAVSQGAWVGLKIKLPS